MASPDRGAPNLYGHDAQYPYLLPPDLSYAEAAAPAITLKLVLGALIPPLYYLFRIFKRRPA